MAVSTSLSFQLSTRSCGSHTHVLVYIRCATKDLVGEKREGRTGQWTSYRSTITAASSGSQSILSNSPHRSALLPPSIQTPPYPLSARGPTSYTTSRFQLSTRNASDWISPHFSSLYFSISLNFTQPTFSFSFAVPFKKVRKTLPCTAVRKYTVRWFTAHGHQFPFLTLFLKPESWIWVFIFRWIIVTTFTMHHSQIFWFFLLVFTIPNGTSYSLETWLNIRKVQTFRMDAVHSCGVLPVQH